MEEIERVATKSRAICEVLFEKVIKSDLESGNLGGPMTVEDLKERYESLLDGSAVWEILNCKVESWKEEETRKYKKADEAALADIFTRHRRIPGYERIEKTLGIEKAERYKAALEGLEAVISIDKDENAKKERWKTKSLEIIYALIVDVISPYHGTGKLAAEYDRWKKTVYARRSKDAESSKKREFWRSTGLWIISRGDEKKWLSYASRQYSNLTKRVARIVHLSRRFRRIMKQNKSNALRYVPKKKPSARSLENLGENLAKIKAYLKGCAVVAQKISRKKK